MLYEPDNLQILQREQRDTIRILSKTMHLDYVWERPSRFFIFCNKHKYSRLKPEWEYNNHIVVWDVWEETIVIWINCMSEAFHFNQLFI